MKTKGGIELKEVKSFAEKLSVFIGKEIGELKHYFLVGIFCVAFLSLFAYLFGIVANVVISIFSWLGLEITFSIMLLLGIILAAGLIINIFGNKKFIESNSFIVIMARSFIKLAEKSKDKDGFKAYKVPLSGLVGIDPIIKLKIAEGRLRIRELELRKKYPDNWINNLVNSDEFLEYKNLLEKIEEQGNKSASICVFTVNGAEETDIDALFSTTPSIITGFPLFGIDSREIKRVDVKVAVSEVTSGTLGK